MAQWLRSHLAVQGHRFDPCSGKIPRAEGQLSPCTPATEARAPRAPCSPAREATAMKSPGMETGEEPLLRAPIESPCAAVKTQGSQK